MGTAGVGAGMAGVGAGVEAGRSGGHMNEVGTRTGSWGVGGMNRRVRPPSHTTLLHSHSLLSLFVTLSTLHPFHLLSHKHTQMFFSFPFFSCPHPFSLSYSLFLVFLCLPLSFLAHITAGAAARYIKHKIPT